MNRCTGENPAARNEARLITATGAPVSDPARSKVPRQHAGSETGAPVVVSGCARNDERGCRVLRWHAISGRAASVSVETRAKHAGNLETIS